MGDEHRDYSIFLFIPEPWDPKKKWTSYTTKNPILLEVKVRESYWPLLIQTTCSTTTTILTMNTHDNHDICDNNNETFSSYFSSFQLPFCSFTWFWIFCCFAHYHCLTHSLRVNSRNKTMVSLQGINRWFYFEIFSALST